MSLADTGVSPVPEQLVDQIVRGYDALHIEFKRMREQQQELQNKLSWAKQQYLDALKRFTPSSASRDFHDFLDELEEAGACEKEGEKDWLSHLGEISDEDRKARAYHIQAADAAREKYDYRRKSADGVSGVRIWAGKSADPAELESDFTTTGTPGRLGCPFAGGRPTVPGAGHHRAVSTPRSSLSKQSFGRRSRKASFHDPIKAEDNASLPLSPERSLAGSVPLCPIRFLDQHSPEEVARYFENHKHEIPRSHEFCVKRFQEDEEVVKKMDSKYANLVSMVKDLGNVHKPMLPDTDDIDVEVEDDGEEEIVQTSTSKVARWAQAVDPGKPIVEEQAMEDEDDRSSRFERPLKDVRVGESPSRPWGIVVPAETHSDGNRLAAKSDATAAPMKRDRSPDALPALRCPFSGASAGQRIKAEDVPHPLPPAATASMNHDPTFLATASLPAAASTSTAHFSQPQEHHPSSSQRMPSQYIFNGPVFFGNYTMEQAFAVMKQAGLKS